MTTTRLLMIAAMLGIAAQPVDRDAVRARLRDEAPLAADEMSRTLQAAREALADQPFRITVGRGMGPEYLIDVDGHVRFLRRREANVEVISEYTRQAAQRCDGSPATASH